MDNKDIVNALNKINNTLWWIAAWLFLIMLVV